MPDEPSCRSEIEQPPSLTIDWEAYLPFFEDEDISEEDKRALIETLWSIAVMFVDIGFDVHPADQICGEADSFHDEEQPDVVSLVKSQLEQTKREEDT